MRWIALGSVVSWGCGGDGPGPEECAAPTAGAWSWNGTCFGMVMSSTVSLGTDGCAFTVGDWDMAMSAPDGGTVSGDEVELDWTGKSDCVGTSDGDRLEGACGDGCTWTATFDG